MSRASIAPKSTEPLDQIGRLIVWRAEVWACASHRRHSQRSARPAHDAIWGAIHQMTYRLQWIDNYERIRKALEAHLTRRFVNPRTGAWKAPRPGSRLDRGVRQLLKVWAMDSRAHKLFMEAAALKRRSA